MDFNLSDYYVEIKNQVIDFAEQFNNQKSTGRKFTDKERVKLMADAGLFDYMFPVKFGGKLNKAYDVTALCIIRQELSRLCSELDGAFAAQGLGGYPILIFGNEKQKSMYLPLLATGEKLGAFALTEKEAGSDVASIRTIAEKVGDHYIINGEKKFISGAGVADFYLVFAKTDPDGGNKGISAFIVDQENYGLKVKPREIIAPHTLGDLEFDNCKITSENLLGNLGSGFEIAMSNLDIFRTTVGAMAVGLAETALELSISRAKSRVQFGRPISKFQAIQFKLAEMATSIRAAKLLVYSAAWQKDLRKNATMESSMAKMFATEVAFNAANATVQIFGGDGLSKDSPVEKLYREVRAPMIYEGTSEIQRIVIAKELLKRSMDI